MKVIVVKNNLVFFRYKCKTFGKSFLNSSEFIEHTSVSCQANKSWSLSEFPYRCECRNKPLILSIFSKILCILGSHCLNPPDPPAESKLLLSWNPDYPPAHDETVLYKCNAGNHHNRFIDDYSRYNYTLTCLPDNQFSEPEWPTCADC